MVTISEGHLDQLIIPSFRLKNIREQILYSDIRILWNLSYSFESIRSDQNVFFFCFLLPVESGLGSVLTSSGSSPPRSQLQGSNRGDLIKIIKHNCMIQIIITLSNRKVTGENPCSKYMDQKFVIRYFLNNDKLNIICFFFLLQKYYML
jgi:hypothetical protein